MNLVACWRASFSIFALVALGAMGIVFWVLIKAVLMIAFVLIVLGFGWWLLYDYFKSQARKARGGGAAGVV
jgi:hypothetical protein